MMTNDEIIYNALSSFAFKTHYYAHNISQKSYKRSDGSVPTLNEIEEALEIATKANALCAEYYRKTKGMV